MPDLITWQLQCVIALSADGGDVPVAAPAGSLSGWVGQIEFVDYLVARVEEVLMRLQVAVV